MSEVHDVVYWDSKQGVRESANFTLKCTDIELLLDLEISNRDSAVLFSETDTRKARICQLKAEMFAARAKELSQPRCSICGSDVSVRYNHHTDDNPCFDCWCWSA